MLFPHAKIVATGRALPTRFVSNSEVEADCGIEPGWIEQRTGILQRPVVAPETAVSDLAIEAGQKALDEWRQNPTGTNQIGMLILATSTPDHLLPPTAPFVAQQLGLGNIPAFDIAVACSGFLYGTKLAFDYCRVNGRPALIIAANILSKRTSRNDPATVALFADGAGAAVVAPGNEPGVLEIELESDGSGFDALFIPDGGSRSPFNENTLDQENHKMKVNNGMAVFRYAVESMARLGKQVLDQSDFQSQDVDWWIPHQANLRIIESVRQRLNIPGEKTAITIDKFANSSAATIPVTLDYFLESGKIEKGDLILLTTAAAGLTSGAALMRI